jgi:hypothetical protein
MINGQSAGSGHRRKRRGRSSSQREKGLAAVLRDSRFGKRLFVAMCLVTAIYCGTILYEARAAALYFGPTVIGMDKNEARYMMGPPPAGQESQPLWTYLENGTRLSVRFGEDGGMKSVVCTEDEAAGGGCLSVLGLRIGTTEDRVWLKLGKPGRETYVGNDKIIYYDDLGFSFTLRRFQVQSIEVHKRESATSFVPRALWMMVP